MTVDTDRVTGRVILGVLVITLGVLFTLDNLGLATAGSVLRWWPALLLIYGVARLTGVLCRPSAFVGVVCAAIGFWMLLREAGVVHGSIWALTPLLLIWWGIALMRGRSARWGFWVHRNGRWERRSWSERGDVRGAGRVIIGGLWGEPSGTHTTGATGPTSGPPPQGEAGSMPESSGGSGPIPGSSGGPGPMPGFAGEQGPVPGSAGESGPGPGSAFGQDAQDSGLGQGARAHGDADFTVDALLSSVSRKVSMQDFRRGVVLAGMGGADIDMRSARMADSRAYLETNLVMGGVNLFVPDDWAVEFQGTTIMGTVEDHSRRPPPGPSRRLLITGVVLMGSLVIKN
ncbi:MAG: hypothetical protein HZB25_13355 [Candidatus Eisenbacteria bacterium]|nr:hypothetical protein [Candidatus Eisenbacteria bacterium]